MFGGKQACRAPATLQELLFTPPYLSGWEVCDYHHFRNVGEFHGLAKAPELFFRRKGATLNGERGLHRRCPTSKHTKL